MLVSMNWIQDFVDLSGFDIEELIRRFTLSTAEVEEIYYIGKDTYGIVVGEILEIKDHPNSKSLHLLKINDGSSIRDCVCGAPNVKVGMKTPFACVGGKVQGNEIDEAIVAGFKSEGMCCSEAELGISDDNSGLMEIIDHVEVGTDFKELYNVDDILFEVDNKSLTNRPDLWGHYGIAREFSVLVERELKIPELYNLDKYKELSDLDIIIENTDLVYRYTGIKINNINARITPVNMRIRLFYCGMRTINLLTDLTNYVMLELGQPMHAFDSRYVDKIIVKRFSEPIKFTTLDDIQRDITEKMLMICNNDKPVAIAGVMGGVDSEIADDTDSLVLESANFDGVSVRKTSTKLGLRTDASMRYEKILDPELTKIASERFVKLLHDIDSGIEISSSLTDIYVKKYEKIQLKFNKSYVDRYTGIEITNEIILKTLRSLGFGVELNDDIFKVSVPTWRATKDVIIKADIIEEITRIYGYDNFQIKSCKSILYPVRKEYSKTIDYYVKELLVEKFNLNEVHSYIWCDRKKYKKLGIEVKDNVSLINSLASDNDVIRSSIIPNLLCMINENKAFDSEYGIFEIGKVVDGKKDNGECNECKKLGMIIFSKDKSEKDLFFHMRDLVLTLSENALHEKFEFINEGNVIHNWQHPKNTISLYWKNKNIGFFSVLHPFNQQIIDKKSSIIVCEIDMNSIENEKPRDMVYEEISKYPSIDIDLSVLVDDDRTFKEIQDLCYRIECPFLKKISVIDVYDNGQKSITFRQYFSSNERTLRMEEIQTYVDKLIILLADNGFMLKQ